MYCKNNVCFIFRKYVWLSYAFKCWFCNDIYIYNVLQLSVSFKLILRSILWRKNMILNRPYVCLVVLKLFDQVLVTGFNLFLIDNLFVLHGKNVSNHLIAIALSIMSQMFYIFFCNSSFGKCNRSFHPWSVGTQQVCLIYLEHLQSCLIQTISFTFFAIPNILP